MVCAWEYITTDYININKRDEDKQDVLTIMWGIVFIVLLENRVGYMPQKSQVYQ